jgi:hypothetical protein
LLVFVFSVPFWLLGAEGGRLTNAISVNLPISSLMAVCPLIAALILTYRENKFSGMKNLLKRVFDFKRTRRKIWYLPVIFLMPLIMILSYGVMSLTGPALPKIEISFQIILIGAILFLVFFISAIGEEVGWSGYTIDPMQDQWGALQASIILGAVWALWHVVPYIEANNAATWIVWECLATVGLRVLIVWLYNNTGKSVFAAIIFHAMIDVTWVLFPIYGSYYNPEISGIIIMITATIAVFLWGPRTLAHYRYR